MAFDYDLFVIGGGSGGVRAARQAASTGAKVALAEQSRLGGTCIIRGCVPKKLMVYASGFPETFEMAKGYGWDVGETAFDWPTFRAKLEAELDRLEGVYRKLIEDAGVEWFAQRAVLDDAHTIRLADGSTRTARHILIATGGAPWVPDMGGGAERALVSDDMFHLDTLPKRILIVGGGYIGCEFACIMNGLGVAVTQYHRGKQILRGFDEEACDAIADRMRADGIDLRVDTLVTDMTDHGPDDGFEVTASDGTTANFDTVLMATGRTPNTEGLGLEALGVGLGKYGAVEVNEYSQTAVPSIYAIGDVTDRVQLTPVAIAEAMAFVDTVFRGNPTPVDHAAIPSAVFTQPEFGSVGLGEAEARTIEPVEIYRTSFKPMETAFSGSDDTVLMKLVVGQSSRRVYGCHIIASGAAEMIQLAGVAVKMGATKEDFDRTVAVHPTMAEEIVTMRAPARAD